MSKRYLLGSTILAAGAGVGFVIGGPRGLALAAICLIAGLLLFFASAATRTGAVGAQATRPAHQKTQVLFLLKEIHARPHRAGKFHEIRDENEAGLEFELFLFCWLVSETELPLRIVDGPHLTLRRPAAPFVTAERIVGDLGSWRLGKLNQELDSSDLLVIRAAQESISELNTAEPLEGGLPRKGWLHFRVRNVTPAQFKASTLELSISDSLSNLHVSTTSGPTYLPGRMWPFTPSAKPASPDTYSGSGPSQATGS